MAQLLMIDQTGMSSLSFHFQYEVASDDVNIFLFEFHIASLIK